jgi:biopolymer transport protein ExbD
MPMFPRAPAAPGGLFELNITSFVDILTVVTMFLVVSFGMSEGVMKPLSDIVLPESTATLPVPQGLKLSVSQTGLRLDNQLVMPLHGGQVPSSEIDEARRIIPLYQALQREKLQFLTGMRTQLELDEHSRARETLYIEAARGLSYGLIDRVLRTAAAAGFTTFRLAVSRKES